MKRIEKLYVAAFGLPPDHRLANGTAMEVLLIGKTDDGNPRFSVEHEPGALLGLISMCRGIAEEERGNGVTLRFLEFENPREIPEEEIQEWLEYCAQGGYHA